MQHNNVSESRYRLALRALAWRAARRAYFPSPFAPPEPRPGPFGRALEHRELTEAACPEARGERAEGPEPDAPVRRERPRAAVLELVAIDGVPVETYPFLPTGQRRSCSLVAFPAIEQPSVADNSHRCE